MLNPNVIHAKTGEAVPLSAISKVEDILACPANIASLCMCIVALSEERKLWTEPSKEMVQAGLAEVQRMLDEWDNHGNIMHGDDATTDAQASDMAVFVLQAMAGKRNG